MGYYTEEILRNAEVINQLHSKIHEAFKCREKNDHKFKEWQNACKEFRTRYNSLAFPGGIEGAFERILNGDPKSIEAALCFIECRPYFFRSGYMFKDLLPKLKRAPLESSQLNRLNRVLEAYANYKKSKAT